MTRLDYRFAVSQVPLKESLVELRIIGMEGPWKVLHDTSKVIVEALPRCAPVPDPDFESRPTNTAKADDMAFGGLHTCGL